MNSIVVDRIAFQQGQLEYLGRASSTPEPTCLEHFQRKSGTQSNNKQRKHLNSHTTTASIDRNLLVLKSIKNIKHINPFF